VGHLAALGPWVLRDGVRLHPDDLAALRLHLHRYQKVGHSAMSNAWDMPSYTHHLTMIQNKFGLDVTGPCSSSDQGQGRNYQGKADCGAGAHL
jgi:hypothetical protein